MNAYNIFLANEIADIMSPSRKENLDAAAHDFFLLYKNGKDINDNDIQETVFFYNDLENLSNAELSYIKHKVENEWL